MNLPIDIFDHPNFLNFNTPQWYTWKQVYDAPSPKFPPYDIEKDGDNFVLTFAVAGYKKENLSVTHVKREKKLQVVGHNFEGDEKSCKCEHTPCNCQIRKGIAKRPFKIEFAVNDVVVDSTTLADGLLTIVVKPVDPPKDEVETIEIK